MVARGSRDSLYYTHSIFVKDRPPMIVLANLQVVTALICSLQINRRLRSFGVYDRSTGFRMLAKRLIWSCGVITQSGKREWRR